MVRSPGSELRGTGIDGLVDRTHAERPPHSAYHVLTQVPQTGDLEV